MTENALTSWVVACALLSLRIAPVFTFAPPFSLFQIPRQFRVLLGIGLSVCLVSASPSSTMQVGSDLGSIVVAGARELLLGSVFVLVFQVAFGALYLAGRTIDIQAGLGLAVLIDPATRSQKPLVGTLLAYAAAMVFFSFDGHLALLHVFSASLDAVPIGSWSPHALSRMLAFMSMTFVMAFGVVGASVLTLFLVDMSIALLSRTVPQMNVLILGFQVKTIALLLVLPVSFGIAGALIVRIMAMTLQQLPRML